MTIFLLRHGEIKTQGPGRFIGQTDAALAEKGRLQARKWAEAWAEITFEQIYSSDLSRCAETAAIIAESRPAEMRFLSDLREIHLGDLEGLSMDFVRREFPEQWRKRGEDIASFTPQGGESFTDLHNRVIPAFETIVQNHSGNVLIIAHAGVNRVILCHVLGMPVSSVFRIAQSSGCLNTFEPTLEGLQVSGINQARPYISDATDQG